MVTGLLLKSIWVIEEWEGCLSEEEGHLWINDCRGIYIKTLNWPYITWSLTSFSPLPSSFTPFISPRFVFSFCSPQGSLLFPRTVRRYRKDHITMATISHIVIAHALIWWLFLFWRAGGCCPYLTGGANNLFWWRRNNVAICWFQVFAHSERRLLWWLTTVNHMATRTSHSGSSSLKQTHLNRGSPLERSGHHGASSFDGSRNGKKNSIHINTYV